MSEAHLKAVEADVAAIPADQVRAPDMPVGVFIHQGEVVRIAAQRDRDDLVAAGVEARQIDALADQLGAAATADAVWQVSRFQGRPQELVQQEQVAFALRDDLLRTAAWGLRDEADAQDRIARIREGDGVPDMIQDLEALAALLRVFGPRMKLPGFDAATQAAECEEMAKTTRELSARWKLDESQRRLLDRRDRAFTLCTKTLQAIRGAAEFKFGKDEPRMAPYRDRYAMARSRKSRAKPTA